MDRSFESLFNVKKPVIGMIHLAGRDSDDRVRRALEELRIYEGEGVDGAIVEDYHGSFSDVFRALEEADIGGFKIVRGANVLSSPYQAFKFVKESGGKFVQFDSVQTPDLNLESYDQTRRRHPDIAVLGGVGFKYTQPTGNSLEQDLAEAMTRCEGIVTTGDGTGIETPVEKLRDYKAIMGNFPLIVGAGVNLRNVAEQLQVGDGAIVGSYFKPDNNTHLPVDRARVKSLMDVVRGLR